MSVYWRNFDVKQCSIYEGFQQYGFNVAYTQYLTDLPKYPIFWFPCFWIFGNAGEKK